MNSSIAIGFVLLVGLSLVAASLWFLFAKGPRRWRAYRRALALLKKRSWREALEAGRKLGALGAPSKRWKQRLRKVRGESERLAGDVALEERRFEDGFAHYQTAAPLLGVSLDELRSQVVQSMLTEARRQFANLADSEVLRGLLVQTLRLQPDCGEALFWQGLLAAREGKADEALKYLGESVTASGRPQPAQGQDGQPQPVPATQVPLDPLLYHGSLLLRAGRVQEALRHLSEANRVFGNCPFVHWQLGTALVAAGKESLALRALHKAIGTAGLPRWSRWPQNAWIEAFPDGSFVRRLAVRHVFRCPVFGHDLAAMVRQAQLTLAQAYSRLERHEEAAALYESMLQESAPTLPVLQGLGLELARLEKYDQAFTHLRAAYELEEPKNHLTAGYLALCAARAKPNRPEEKADNLRWAVQHLCRFSVASDVEWAGICAAVLAEARAGKVGLSAVEQRRLCDALASVEMTTAEAAWAYEQLAASDAAAVRATHAWLYCRAAQLHNVGSPTGLPLFERTLHDAAARSFFTQRNWNFEDVEYAYLRRLASTNGSYEAKRLAAQGTRTLRPQKVQASQEALLLKRSRVLEDAGQLDEAQQCAETLLALVPESGAALDRLAYLAHTRGKIDESIHYLELLEQRAPGEPLPCLRRGIIEQQRGRGDASLTALKQALERATGKRRGGIAFYCARTALALCPADRRHAGEPAWEAALAFLEQCLQSEPAHERALACLAAMQAVSGRQESLAALAAPMTRCRSADPEIQYLAALCQLAAGQADAARTAALEAQALAKERQQQSLARECSFVIGWALYLQGNHTPAAVELAIVADAAAQSPSADLARALLGRIALEKGDLPRAAFWWSAVGDRRRQAWNLDQTLANTILYAGLAAFREERFADAAKQFREAREHGCAVAGLGRLIQASHIRAAASLLHAPHATPSELQKAAKLLSQIQHDRLADSTVPYLLALTHKRLKNWPEARKALQHLGQPDAQVLLQAGILALHGGGGIIAPVQQAAEEWERALALASKMEDAKSSSAHGKDGAAARSEVPFAIAFNLLRVRLSLGQWEPAKELAAQAAGWAPTNTDRRFLEMLHVLLLGQEASGSAVAQLAGMSEEIERQLLRLIRTVGNLDTAERLLQSLVAARPQRVALAEAMIEITVLKGLQLLEHCQGQAGAEVLAPLARRKGMPPAVRAGLLNALGCCYFLSAEFTKAAKAFGTALELDAQDPRLHQNLALICEILAQARQNQERYGELAQLEWNRYLELLPNRIPVPPGHPRYWEQVKFEALHRLAQRAIDGQQPAAAVEYLQQAEALRPDDVDTVEKLLQVLNELHRFEEAKSVLVRLNELRQQPPVVDVIEVVDDDSEPEGYAI